MTEASLVAKNMSKPWENNKEKKNTITSTEYDKLICNHILKFTYIYINNTYIYILFSYTYIRLIQSAV